MHVIVILHIEQGLIRFGLQHPPAFLLEGVADMADGGGHGKRYIFANGIIFSPPLAFALELKRVFAYRFKLIVGVVVYVEHLVQEDGKAKYGKLGGISYLLCLMPGQP